MNSQVSPSSNEEGCSCDDGNSSTSPLELTLENFDSDQVPDDCPFVLTSPRSLEACKLVGVRVSKWKLVQKIYICSALVNPVH